MDGFSCLHYRLRIYRINKYIFTHQRWRNYEKTTRKSYTGRKGTADSEETEGLDRVSPYLDHNFNLYAGATRSRGKKLIVVSQELNSLCIFKIIHKVKRKRSREASFSFVCIWIFSFAVFYARHTKYASRLKATNLPQFCLFRFGIFGDTEKIQKIFI